APRNTSPHVQRVVFDDLQGGAQPFAKRLNYLEQHLRVRGKHGPQVVRMDHEELNSRHGDSIGPMSLRREYRHLANRVARPKETTHDLPAIDFAVGDLDPARNNDHQRIAVLLSSAQNITSPALPGATSANERFNGGLGEPSQKCLVLQDLPKAFV